MQMVGINTLGDNMEKVKFPNFLELKKIITKLTETYNQGVYTVAENEKFKMTLNIHRVLGKCFILVYTQESFWCWNFGKINYSKAIKVCNSIKKEKQDGTKLKGML